MMIAEQILEGAVTLRETLKGCHFGPPVSHVYQPLDYAWQPYEQYVRQYANSTKKIIFVGMNPGPFGMVQTGIPFGEIAAVRDWLQLRGQIDTPAEINPAKPVEGWQCQRSEVSGRRLWGLFQQRFGSAEAFFKEHFVANYCPLAFFAQGRNVTPDKLPVDETRIVFNACDQHLRTLINALAPERVIGVGAWAEKRIQLALKGSTVDGSPPQVTRILHPSPASPAANRGWAEAAVSQLQACGAW